MIHHPRLTLLEAINPKLYKETVSFVEENPEFTVLLPYTALTEYPIGFNKNPGEPFDPYAPTNIFETLIYGIASAGVRSDYGNAQYKQIVSYLRRYNYFEENMEFPFKVQPKKIQVYKDFINILLQNDIITSQMKLQDLDLVKQVKGIGVTAISLCHDLYGDRQLLPYTDRQFYLGFAKLYNIPKKPTKNQMLDVTNKWTNKKIGHMFIDQCFYYYK